MSCLFESGEHIKQEKKKLWHLFKKMDVDGSVDEVCYQTAGSALI